MNRAGVITRWILLRRTTVQGKRLYACRSCGRNTLRPTVDCPGSRQDCKNWSPDWRDEQPVPYVAENG